MNRIVYVNGKYLSENEARVSIFDRGFLFADGVYEVTSVLDGKLIDFPGHLRRLARSLNELGMAAPCTDNELLDIHRELVSRNNLHEGMIYLQVTRGEADRDFIFPENAKPTIVLFTQAKNLTDSSKIKTGYKVITVPDLRWRRRDIKTVQLLYPSMAKMEAIRAGADDAWLVEDEFITEGTSNNAYIVQASGIIVTRNLSNDILHGITRATLLQFAAEEGVTVEQRPFTLDEALEAEEAFITAASLFVAPVIEIDGKPVGNGKPGPIVGRLRKIYLEKSLQTAM